MDKHLDILKQLLENYYRSTNKQLGMSFTMNDVWEVHIKRRIINDLKHG